MDLFQASHLQLQNTARQLLSMLIGVDYIEMRQDTEVLFVCVEVLWPSQPNGVMSSAVSLPNHTFTGQA